MNIQDIIDVTGGRPSPGSYHKTITNVVIDSRKAVAGSLFVAFTGENTDGHKYLLDCAGRGAVAALVEQEVTPPPGMVTIKVDITLKALQELSAWQRDRLIGLTVIGVTGSSGKTTTKELVAGVVSQRFSTLKTKGNHNNEIGLPLTMFEILPEHNMAVLEMGMGAAGEIRRLCEISKPGIGIITNIGEAHIEHLGSKEAILEAKFEIAEELSQPGVLILNGDDEMLRKRVNKGYEGHVIFYGFGDDNDIQATNIEMRPDGSNFDIIWDNKISANLHLPGLHNVSNALAAFAVGLVLEMPPQDIISGLAQVQGETGRLQSIDVDGITVIDDSYNANPDSTIRALEVLAQYPSERRKVAFLGDMLELGEITIEKHQMIGAAAARMGVSLLVAVGEYAKHIKEGAMAAGMPDSAVQTWLDSPKAVQAIKQLQQGDVVLFKGSRGVEMEIIVDLLKDGGY